MRKRYMIFTILFIILSISTSFNTMFYNATPRSKEGSIVFKTGKYYAKVSSVGEMGKAYSKWDISISDKESKKNIIENKENEQFLEIFKDRIVALKKMKNEVFTLVIGACLFVTFSIMCLLDKNIKINIYLKILLVLPLLIIGIFFISGMKESLSNLTSLDKSIGEIYGLIP